MGHFRLVHSSDVADRGFLNSSFLWKASCRVDFAFYLFMDITSIGGLNFLVVLGSKYLLHLIGRHSCPNFYYSFSSIKITSIYSCYEEKSEAI